MDIGSTMKLTKQQITVMLSTIELDLTEFCNYSCHHCSRVCEMAPSNREMTIDQVNDFVKESIELDWKWKRIRLIGGEPTMHSKFLEVLNVINEYKKHNPNCLIDMMTNGGKTYRRIKDKIPNWLHVIDHANFKTCGDDVRHHAFYVAPIDVGQWNENNVCCYSPGHCGMSLGVYGYYPCVLCGAINRTFKLDVPAIQSLKDVTYEKLTENLHDFCKLCGDYLSPRNKRNILEYPKNFISESWQKAFEKYEKINTPSNKVGML